MNLADHERDLPELVRIADVATLAGVDRKTIYNHRKTGLVTAERVPPVPGLRVRRAAALKYIRLIRRAAAAADNG